MSASRLTSRHRKLTPIQALRLVESVAAHAGVDRVKFGPPVAGGFQEVLYEDEVMALLYRIAHSTLCECFGCSRTGIQKRWQREARERYKADCR